MRDQVVAGDPNLGSHLEHAVDMIAQQRRQQVLSEQTPIKERLESDFPDKESDKGSSSVDGISALESDKGSGLNLSVLSSFSILKENSVGTEQKWGDLPDESAEGDELITIDDEENKDEESVNGSVPSPLESTNGSGTALKESNSDAFTSSSASAHESSDWITNRINRIRNLSLDPTQMKEIIPPSVPRGRGTEEDKAIWHKFLNGTALIEQNASSARTASSSTRESYARENAAPSASSSADNNVPPDPRLHPYNDAGNLDPRFLFTDDIHEAMDALIEQGEEEILPERLLLGHFKFLFEEGKLNTTEDVKAASLCSCAWR